MNKPVTRNIKVDDVEVEFIRKKMKTLRISVLPPDGRVKLSVPLNVSDEMAFGFVKSKLDWINKHREKFQKTEAIKTKEYQNGEAFYVSGVKYTINILETIGKMGVVLGTDRIIYIKVKNGSTVEERKKILEDFLRLNLKKDIPNLLEKWQPIMGVKANSWGVRAMKTRWGTCNIRAKRIWLNLHLAQRDPDCLEYVVIHELAHLIEASHGDRFKAIMDKFYPNWREIRKSMKNFSV